jgi:hypothetical protein
MSDTHTLPGSSTVYGLFTANAERYRESHNVVYAENGSIEKHKLRSIYHNEDHDDYSAFEFLPFDAIDRVVKLYGKAVEAFGDDIIRHFNRKYGVSVPEPDFDDEKLPIGFLPEYQTYVDAVIGHLGGKGFRETAEEELIARFHEVVMPGYSKKLKAELKSDRIVVSDVLRYDDYSWSNTLDLKWESVCRLNELCAGIIFGATDSLTGRMAHIAGFDRCDVDVSRWYNLSVSESVSVKFYKNHRVDFKFENATVAERCWKKLRLDTFKTQVDDE